MANNPQKFDIYQMLNRENSHVTLYCKNHKDSMLSTEIHGFLTNDTFPLQGVAQYDDISDASIDFAKLGNSAFGAFGQSLGGVANLVARATNFSRRPAFTTLAYWNNSEKPQFQVDLLFVRYSIDQPDNTRPLYCAKELVSRCFPVASKADDEVWNVASSAMKTTLNAASAIPVIGSTIGAIAEQVNNAMTNLSNLGFLEAPCGYSPLEAITSNDNPFGRGRRQADGTWSLKIGKWFHATNLILQNAQFEASKETAPDGTPIYVTGSVQLESCVLITWDVYHDWFIDNI